MPHQRLAHDWFSLPLPDNIRLGKRTWLYSSYAFAHYSSEAPVGLRVGSDTGLYHGTFFDLGPNGEVEIGDYCSLVGAIFATNGRVTIGNYTFIAHEVVIGGSDWAAPVDRTTNGDSHYAVPRGDLASKAINNDYTKKYDYCSFTLFLSANNSFKLI